MARTFKYKEPNQVLLELIKSDGANRLRILDMISRHKDKCPEYAAMLKEGLNKYDRYKLNKELKELGYIDPEDMLTEDEYDDCTGHRG